MSAAGGARIAPMGAEHAEQAGVVEHSVYVHPAARGQDVGAAPLRALLASTEVAGIWIAVWHVPENTAGLAPHRQAGFRVIGTRERVGRHHNRWRDARLVEHRSTEP